MGRQIYLDNSATAWPKAPGVGRAMADYVDRVGVNVGRSSYGTANQAAWMVLETREKAAAFLGCAQPSHVVFTPGVTHSLNLVLKGLLRPGDHLVISAMEHNAVWRPAAQLAKAGVAVDVAPCDAAGWLDPDVLRALLRPNTRLVVLNHASNVCGTIQDAGTIGAVCRERGVFFALDTAQTAGHLPLHMEEMGVSALCFTGHKGLLGPQGIGGVAVSRPLAQALEPLVAGGTGSLSSSPEMPRQMPDRLEAGTLNLPGIAGLSTALDYLTETGAEALRRREIALTKRLLDGILDHPHLYVPGPADAARRVGVVSVAFKRRDNGEAAYRLEQTYGILVRSGLHCAPLAHRSLDTFPQGTVRFSIGHGTTVQEIDAAIEAVSALA
ncbi:MAG: aminotransferase class V-fold PLP-dependent enzyme [Clostridiales bacterium]|nr:aminotransferase class V-fold PLP-dependent enzyme [Clostridiales bacterium]